MNVTKQEYAVNLSKLITARDMANNAIYKLKGDYIQLNREYSNGEKVKIIADDGAEHIAFVLNCDCLENGEIFYRFWKPKANGEVSKHRFYIHHITSNYTIKKYK